MKPGSDLWKEQRRSILTASDFAAACGLNPYCSRQELWRRKINKTDIVINERMQWGMDHEQDAINAYEKATGWSVTPPTGLYRHDHKYLGLGCTPDGFVGDLGLIEVKCPQVMYRDIPIYYLTQMVGQLAILVREWCEFVVWTPDKLKVWTVNDIDLSAWEWMLPFLEEFVYYLNGEKEPPKWKAKPKGSELLKRIEIHPEIPYNLTNGRFRPTEGS
jgi:putative phage-type endonuclease